MLNSEQVGIISIIFLGASMFFGILGIFVYTFVFFSLITFIAGIIIGVYALYLSNK